MKGNLKIVMASLPSEEYLVAEINVDIKEDPNVVHQIGAVFFNEMELKIEVGNSIGSYELDYEEYRATLERAKKAVLERLPENVYEEYLKKHENT